MLGSAIGPAEVITLRLDEGTELGFQMNPLMFLMKSNLKIPCLDLDLDNKLVLHLVLLMMLWAEINMACWN